MSNITIKKIDKLVLRTFITTFILLLGLVLFVMVIQSFFMIFSGIAGKGLGIAIYSKLLFYLSLNLFPDAFPVTTLMTSLIVFGNFSENCELTAMRSVGLSLQRTLRVPFICILILTSLLFYFQNYIYPNSKNKIFSLVSDVWTKKSSLFIQQGIFCTNIPGYSIRVEKKSIDNNGMEGIILYDYTKKHGKVFITVAEKGKLYTTPNEDYLVMELTNGHNYIEPLRDKNDDANAKETLPFYRNSFSNQKIKISLEALKLDKTNSQYTFDPRTRTRPDLKKMIQKREKTLIDELTSNKKLLVQEAIKYYPEEKSNTPENDDKVEELISPAKASAKDSDFMLLRNHLIEKKIDSDMEFATKFDDYTLQRIIEDAFHNVDQKKQFLIDKKNNEAIVYASLNEALYEQNHRSAVAIRCIIMFLLAAPLGCIIRRGGFGISVIISSFFILLEYTLSIFGRDYAMLGTISSCIGAWLPNLILLPFCFFFLVKAEQGRGLWSSDWYIVYMKIKKGIKRKNRTKLEV